jgi:hypothetical protein
MSNDQNTGELEPSGPAKPPAAAEEDDASAQDDLGESGPA